MRSCLRASCCAAGYVSLGRWIHRRVPTAARSLHSSLVCARRRIRTSARGSPAPTSEDEDDAWVSAFESASDTLYHAEMHAHGIAPLPGIGSSQPLLPPDAESLHVSDDSADVGEMMDLMMNPCLDGADVLPSEVDVSRVSAPNGALTLPARGSSSADAVLLSVLAGDGRAQSTSQAAAVELLTTGLDIKGVMSGKPFVHCHFSHRSFRQCDLSLMHFEHVSCDGCDFERSLFYRAQFAHVVFRHCRFDGAVLREIECYGDVSFHHCSFRLADMGLHRVKKSGGDLRFVSCDFDLATFEGCQGLNDPRFFKDCQNTHVAHRFPLRA